MNSILIYFYYYILKIIASKKIIMKKNIKLTISKYLYKLLESNPFLVNLFSEVIAHNIIDYNKIKKINIHLLFQNNYLYYMITLLINDNSINSEIFYGKLQTNEINIVIS